MKESKLKNALQYGLLPIAIFGLICFVVDHYFGATGIGIFIAILWGGSAIHVHIKKHETSKQIKSKMNDDLQPIEILSLLKEAYASDNESLLVIQLMNKLEVSLKRNKV